MAVRKARTRIRRELITRTARVWTRLSKELEKDLEEISANWINGLCEKKFPDKFTEKLKSALREALAYGYWLQWLYLYELRGEKYRGKINLSEGDSIKESVQKFMNTGEWNDVIPKDAANWVKNYTPILAGNFSRDILEKTRDVIHESLLEGTTHQDREKELQKVLDISKTRIESIARTEITRAHNLGSLTAMKANDDVIGVEFSAVLDNRTTEICQHRHGLVMRLDDPRLAENTPPLHVRCRSMLLALTIYDYPDGLLTSHEFDDGISESQQRPEDIEEVKKILDNKNDIKEVRILSGALNDKNDPYEKKRNKHAELYYEELRNSNAEHIIKKLSKNSGVSFNTARKIYEHVFINEYELDDGLKRFDPSYDMAQSIQRLLLGEDIQEHDIILLHHERMEYELMNNLKKDYKTAHNITNSRYDYFSALQEWQKERNQ